MPFTKSLISPLASFVASAPTPFFFLAGEHDTDCFFSGYFGIIFIFDKVP